MPPRAGCACRVACAGDGERGLRRSCRCRSGGRWRTTTTGTQARRQLTTSRARSRWQRLGGPNVPRPSGSRRNRFWHWPVQQASISGLLDIAALAVRRPRSSLRPLRGELRRADRRASGDTRFLTSIPTALPNEARTSRGKRWPGQPQPTSKRCSPTVPAPCRPRAAIGQLFRRRNACDTHSASSSFGTRSVSTLTPVWWGNPWAESAVIQRRIEGSSEATPVRAKNFAGAVSDFTAEQIMLRPNPGRPDCRESGAHNVLRASPRAGLFAHTYNWQAYKADVLRSAGYPTRLPRARTQNRIPQLRSPYGDTEQWPEAATHRIRGAGGVHATAWTVEHGPQCACSAAFAAYDVREGAPTFISSPIKLPPSLFMRFVGEPCTEGRHVPRQTFHGFES